uniref:Uncharacterized protein n=1 Tax=Cacopsylla melanoneura TaxID=428564 RepID=A0A8D8UT23_9HEMI
MVPCCHSDVCCHLMSKAIDGLLKSKHVAQSLSSYSVICLQSPPTSVVTRRTRNLGVGGSSRSAELEFDEGMIIICDIPTQLKLFLKKTIFSYLFPPGQFYIEH